MSNCVSDKTRSLRGSWLPDVGPKFAWELSKCPSRLSAADTVEALVALLDHRNLERPESVVCCPSIAKSDGWNIIIKPRLATIYVQQGRGFRDEIITTSRGLMCCRCVPVCLLKVAIGSIPDQQQRDS